MAGTPFCYVDPDSLRWDGSRLWFEVVRPALPAKGERKAQPERRTQTCIRGCHLQEAGFPLPEEDPFHEPADMYEVNSVMKQLDADTAAYLAKQTATANANKKRIAEQKAVQAAAAQTLIEGFFGTP